MLKILELALAALAMIYVVRQVRKPDRWLGRLFATIMNWSHSELTDWGLTHVSIVEDFTILDIGCGGGKTIEKLAAIAAKGKIYGVDYAAGSVATSRAKNTELIQKGRVKIEQASVSNLPFGPDQFDLVTAIETQYYWPDMVNDMREILRVLRPGGTLAVILESYIRGSSDLVQEPVMKLLGMARMGVRQQLELFERAGFSDVLTFEELDKGWLCITGTKPGAHGDAAVVARLPYETRNLA